jgi:hypothetical protein
MLSKRLFERRWYRVALTAFLFYVYEAFTWQDSDAIYISNSLLFGRSTKVHYGEIRVTEGHWKYIFLAYNLEHFITFFIK